MAEGLDIEYIEKEIKDLISAISSQYYNHRMNEDYNDEYDPNGVESHIWLLIRRLYPLISVYIESKGLTVYLSAFIAKYQDKINDFDFCLTEKENPNYEEVDQHDLTIIDEFEYVLRPFSAFNVFYERSERLTTLEHILEETATIIKHNNVIVTNEDDIYKQVRWILQFVYPGVRAKNKARFISNFKTYSPDILIPDHTVAVEYKYIRQETDVEKYIDEVKIDATNYINDPDYKIFYAVFYINDSGIYTKASIIDAWDKKIFPLNWKPIIVKAS